jgi:hypothetical protein
MAGRVYGYGDWARGGDCEEGGGARGGVVTSVGLGPYREGMMKNWTRAGLAAVGAVGLSGACLAAGEMAVNFERLGWARVAGAEIVDFDPATRQVLVAGRDGVSVLEMSGEGRLKVVRQISAAQLAATAGLAPGADVTHVMADPAGRGFAACTIVPVDRAREKGRVAFFSTSDGAVRGAVSVGFGPDAFKFSGDGMVLVSSDEGDAVVMPDGTVADPVGGVSVIDLSGVKSGEDLAGLDQSKVKSTLLEGPVVMAALEPKAAAASGLRIAERARGAGAANADLEPESLVISGGKVYLTLQENSGVAVFDLATGAWTGLSGLGVISCVVDASDRDGLGGKPAIKIEQKVDGLPMPDQVGTVEIGGRRYVVVAGEGDDRGDADERNPTPIADRARIKFLGKEGKLAASVSEEARADKTLGRLRVCVDWGKDAAGLIDKPTMQGTRSVLVYDAATLALVGETGSQVEQAMAQYASEWFNANSDSSTIDRRSSDRGPEPEGVATAVVGGKPVAIVTIERPGAVAAVDLSDPKRPRVTGLYVSADDGDTGPEGVCYVPAEASPTGKALVIAGFESSGTVVVYSVASAK